VTHKYKNKKRGKCRLTNKIIPDDIRFKLKEETIDKIRSTPYEFGFPESEFGKVTFMRTYSRTKENGQKEDWHDVVIRCMEGVFTIRKWWYEKNKIKWQEQKMQKLAFDMAISMTQMKWLPPGRGLWAQGTNFIYERGSTALYNCSLISINKLEKDCPWLMEMLAYGVGVGFVIGEVPQKIGYPSENEPEVYVIDDSREGWANSVRRLIESYTKNKTPVQFDYSKIRPEGAPLKSFGGTASGPDPLKILHKRINIFFTTYIENRQSFPYTWSRLVTDICNAIGVAIVAGSSRRSAEIVISDMSDPVFLDLKNYNKFPERQSISWMSNNSVRLWTKEDFLKVPELCDRILKNGEPGIINMVNLRKYARMGEEKEDDVDGTNPCGEVALSGLGEVCNIAEIIPIKCKTKQEFLNCCHYATFYCSTITLLPTHSSRTNKIVMKNRRIGISLTGIAQWIETYGMAQCIRFMRDGYKEINQLNKLYNKQAKVKESVRLTTVKPSGTLGSMCGVANGIHWPIHRYAIRRIIINKSDNIYTILSKAGYSHEPVVEFTKQENIKDRKSYPKYKNFASEGLVPVKSEINEIFEFPIHLGKARPATQVSGWEQFAMLATLQREWADNAVSCTITINEKEKDELQYMLAQFLPVIKTVSILPQDNNSYPQMPYEKITKEEYEEKIKELKPIDWTKLTECESNITSAYYCESDKCELKPEVH
jgi:ribonucleoside-diphosphate reductase alpha chain